MAKSINMVVILGNLTRAPELRYTPAGHAVCSFGVATNRVWTTAEKERREEVEFHNVVAWNRLAEICSQYLTKGQKVYIQGRLQTRTWDGQDKVRRSRTEIVADDMVMLQRPGGAPPPAVPEVDRSDLPAGKAGEVKKEIKEEIRQEAVEETKGEEISGNRPENQRKSTSKGKEDVDPKKMPF